MFARRRATAAGTVATVLLVALAAGCGGADSPRAGATTGSARAAAGSPAPPQPVRLRLVARRTLPAPVQLPAVAVVRGRLLAAGGLSAADSSVDSILAVAGPDVPAPRVVGRLPQPVHDAAAAGLGRDLLVLGGGSASGPVDAIVAAGPSGRTARVGRLPAPSSDIEAARVGGTVYVIGGFDGAAPSREVLAFTTTAR